MELIDTFSSLYKDLEEKNDLTKTIIDKHIQIMIDFIDNTNKNQNQNQNQPKRYFNEKIILLNTRIAELEEDIEELRDNYWRLKNSVVFSKK